MAQKTSFIKKDIGDLLRNLFHEKGLDISQIILFGSYAKQTESEESDIDLIIVSPNFRDKSLFERVELTTGVDRTLVKTFKKPFDLMFYSDIEWNRLRSPVIEAAKQEGQIL
ncbi:MAG: nucleotidyltransferase domain-containing protein [Candidatus Omnitrophota bacterium]